MRRMTRMTFAKLYRAFPELDRFSDAECRRFCEDIYRRKRIRRVAVAAFVLVALPAMALLLYQFGFYHKGRHRNEITFYAAALFTIPPAFVISLIIRDIALRRAVRQRILEARCAGCRFSLLGLPVRDGTTKCPECGEEVVLADYGLVAADIAVVCEVRGPLSDALAEEAP